MSEKLSELREQRQKMNTWGTAKPRRLRKSETSRYKARASAWGRGGWEIQGSVPVTLLLWHTDICVVLWQHFRKSHDIRKKPIIQTCSPEPSLCSRVSASSGDTAEGMAPPRGGDCNFLKLLVITRTRTGPLASSQPPQRAPIYKHRTEQQTEAIHAPQTNWKWPIWEIGIVTLNQTQGNTQQEEQWRKINKSQLSCHSLDLHSVSVVFLHTSALWCGQDTSRFSPSVEM